MNDSNVAEGTLLIIKVMKNGYLLKERHVNAGQIQKREEKIEM